MHSPDTQLYKIKSLEDIHSVIKILRSLDLEEPWNITLSRKPPTRTIAQNALLWVYNTAIGRQTVPKYDKDDIHLWARFKILKTTLVRILDVEFRRVPETKNLSVKKMQEYLLELESLALTHGYDLPALDYREQAIR